MSQYAEDAGNVAMSSRIALKQLLTLTQNATNVERLIILQRCKSENSKFTYITNILYPGA
jgi:hypothetical protein